ncbi:MAG: RNB domain-containing ribonuclease [Gloeobacterales cyanobacterium]
MTSLRFPPQAIALSKALALDDALWQRPQVQGITIDGPDSRDLDDAVWIEPTSTGAILSVHIADVSELVGVGSILDKVAIARTTTQYFRNGNAPMLPRALSEDKLSLWEYQDRPTLTIQVSLNRNAQIEQTEIFESWLRSSKRFHYQEAESTQKDPHLPFSDLLQTAYLWAEQLYRNRLNAGAIGATLTAQGDWLSEEGSLIQGKRHSSHLLIQEFMILANRAVALWLADQDIPALYRNHTARAIAPDRETMYQELLLLRTAADVRKRMASWLNRADYGPSLIGHFALNLPAYCHFTSPIRRLADLVNHRIVKALLRGQDTPYNKTELEQLGKHIAQVTRDNEKETSEYFKEAHQQVYQAQVQDPVELENLSEKEFSRVLKYAIENQELEAIALELKSRLASRKLQLQDVYLLLFQSGEEDFQQRAYWYLKDSVQDAASIIAMASTQQPDWESFDYEELGEISPFTTWLEVKIGGEVLTTVHPSEHQRKQPARHHACLMWIEAYLQNALVSPEQRVEPEPKVDEVQEINEPVAETKKPAQTKARHPALLKKLKDGQNFIGMLDSVCQTLRWEQSRYEFTESEPGFECVCRLSAQGDLVTGIGVAIKKQKAKNIAAGRVLEQLQAIAEQKWSKWSAGV